MKITDQDIARAARSLRDEENSHLQVPQWQNRKPAGSKLRYALPAAAVIGFVLGYLTPRSATLEESTLTAIADTIYIKVHELKEDTLPRPEELTAPRTETPVKKARGAARHSRKRQSPATGVPMAADKIRYELLVQN